MRASLGIWMAAGALTLGAGASAHAADYDAREWGVLDLQDGGGTLRTEAPPQPRERIVKAPVLYFTTRDRQPFSLTVSFPHGSPLETYPQALTAAASLAWTRVEFVGEGATPTAAPVPDCAAGLVQALGQVAAAPLLARGQATRFLYYEALAELEAPLTARWDGQRLILSNRGTAAIGPISVSTNDGSWLRSELGYASWKALKPGASATLDLQPDDQAAAFPDLRRWGFADAEAAAFEAYWRMPLLHPRRQHPWAKALYRLPPPLCDQVAQLGFDPAPKALTRALFVLQDLPPRPRPGRP